MAAAITAPSSIASPFLAENSRLIFAPWARRPGAGDQTRGITFAPSANTATNRLRKRKDRHPHHHQDQPLHQHEKNSSSGSSRKCTYKRKIAPAARPLAQPTAETPRNG
jgi:hypothetical protein